MTIRPIETVTISKREYDDLVDEALKLACLEEAGVDDWERYGEAMELYQEQKNNGLGKEASK